MTSTYQRQQLFSTRDAPSSLGRFGIVRALGSGPSSSVYMGFDPETSRELVVVLMDCGTGIGLDQRADAVLEQVEAWRSLQHPSIVRIRELGTYQDPRHPNGGGVFLTHEHIMGMDMQGWLDALTVPCALPWSDVLGMFVNVGRGVAEAHAAGLVHGGFSPASMLVGFDGRTHLLDFSCRGAAALEGTTISAARAAYAAPEVVEGHSPTPASDQYSFAATVWTGLQRVTGGKIPKRVETILQRGLSANPADRWQSLEGLLGALERSGHGLLRRTFETAFVGAASVAGLAALSQ